MHQVLFGGVHWLGFEWVLCGKLFETMAGSRDRIVVSQ